jgi:hypothetical protein
VAAEAAGIPRRQLRKVERYEMWGGKRSCSANISSCVTQAPSGSSGWQGDTRPKSAGAPGAAQPAPVRQASAGASGGRTGAADQGSNSMSYGSLKNRFLSGSKNKSKLFGR